MGMETYYPCCGKSICQGCFYSCLTTGNENCPFCKAETDKTNEEEIEEILKRVEVNDAGAMCVLGTYYHHGVHGLQQDRTKAMNLWKQAAELGSSNSHFAMGGTYDDWGYSEKAKFHFEAAAMAGHERARCIVVDFEEGKKERAIKHWMIAASAGDCYAMKNLLIDFKQGVFSRESIDSTLTAYNNSCAEMRSEARDAYIRLLIDRFDEN